MIRKPGIFAFVSVYFCFNIMIKMWERWVFNLDFFLKWGTVAFQCYVSSAVQWNKSAICVHISFPSHPTFWHHTPLGHRKAPHWAPCGVQQAPTHYLFYISSVQFSSVTQSCPTLFDPMNHSIPGLPVHHHLPEFTQTHVHRVREVIQPSHPRSSLSPPAPTPSQHQSLFQWVNSSHEVAKVLEFQL